MLIIGSAQHKHQFDQLTVTLDNCVIRETFTAKNLGVTFNPVLSFGQ